MELLLMDFVFLFSELLALESHYNVYKIKLIFCLLL